MESDSAGEKRGILFKLKENFASATLEQISSSKRISRDSRKIKIRQTKPFSSAHISAKTHYPYKIQPVILYIKNTKP
jgi:hypothetical protein